MEKTIEIPEGYKARIESNKVILEPKENEDERIRKEILDYIVKGSKSCYDVQQYGKEKFEKWIAWFEKQSKQKPVISDEAIREGVAHFGITQYQINNWLKKYIDVEKQGEQNLANSAKTCNVEPKFKVGDWVIHRSQEGVIYQVEKSFLDGTYRIVPVNDTIGKAITAATEDAIRLWTIQDVKCGDIIYHPKGLGVETISIVRGWEQIEGTGRTLCSSIVLRVADNEIVESSIGAMWWKGVVDTFYPATKEQRGLLFQKMKEAGYEWDAEKKELVKIEQKPSTSVIEFDTEVERFCKESFITDTNEKGNVFCIARHFADWQKNRQNPDWSEEDEINFNLVYTYVPDNALRNWLKSLKERYTWKPSLAQMESLDLLSRGEGSRHIILRSLYNDIKKLKG